LTIETVARPGSMKIEEARIQNAVKIRRNKKRMLLKTITNGDRMISPEIELAVKEEKS
jgi:hypothetical protein